MKSALALVLMSLATLAVASHSHDTVHRRSDETDKTTGCTGSWFQKPKGKASFTSADNCVTPSCGVNTTTGYGAAVNELAFGANTSFGDACGRCFKITPTSDPFNPQSKGPFGHEIVVKVNNLCLDNNPGNTSAADPHWCGQTVSRPRNKFNMSMHFDLCSLTGASKAFFPSSTRLAMLGEYEEVSCKKWKGTLSAPLWNGSCMANNSAPFWPASACGNNGCPPP